MRLKRFLTAKEKDRLIALSQKDELNSDNKTNYYHCEQKKTEDSKWINNLLKDVICGFNSFSNFVTSSRHGLIRIQYNWNYDYPNDMPFIGVGFVTVNELEKGFETVQKEG